MFYESQEVSAISIIQNIQPDMEAILLKMSDGGVSWNISDFESDAERKSYHEKKMASKDSRPAIQLAALGLVDNSGYVSHISHVKT